MDKINYDMLRSLVDIVIVTYLLYKIVILTLGTKAFQIIKGLIAVILIWLFSNIMGLDTLKFIMTQVLTYGIFGVFVVFQQELRQGLEKIGRAKIFGISFSSNNSVKDKGVVDSVVSATEYLSKRNIGALITFERLDSLNEFIKTGIEMDAKISKELLINVFTPNVPLHDGAMIVRGNRIVTASSYLPLSESDRIPKELGTRHRSAIGVSEVTDSITLIVSEETGGISLTYKGSIYRNLTTKELRKILVSALCESTGKDNNNQLVVQTIEECLDERKKNQN